jgi:hypothetical protein
MALAEPGYLPETGSFLNGTMPDIYPILSYPILKALADPDPGHSHHLLSPFLALLFPDKYTSNDFKTYMAWQDYQIKNAKELNACDFVDGFLIHPSLYSS